MIVFPNCKINLGLQVLRKRADSYHDLSTVFYPIPLQDSLELIADNSLDTDVQFTSSGLAVNAATGDNLCVKAFRLLKQRFPGIPACRLHLHKVIPMGAGLGGGSSDAAFTLQLVNNRFKLGLTVPELLDYALQLGSDCPFFIINQPCHATGRGEVLTPIKLDLSAYRIVLVCPPIHIATPWAYKSVTPAERSFNHSDLVSLPVNTWKDVLENDFEEPVFREHPALREIHQQLYDLGAVFAAMSGSGSTLFGLFEKVPPALQDKFRDMEVHVL